MNDLCGMTNLSHSEDSQIILRLYEEYNRYIYKLAWQYCSKPEDIDDLVQEIWVRICAKSQRIAAFEKPQLLAYLAAVVRNTAYSFYRTVPNEVPLEYANRISYNETDILNRILDRNTSVKVFRTIWPYVPETSRELLERKYFLKESDSEIAEALGINKDSVRTYLSRARKTALSVLDEYKDILR